MMHGLLTVGYFTFVLIFSVLIFVLWMRIILRYFRVSTLHPISQSIHRLTNPFITPLNHLFHFSKTRLSRYDWATFGILLVVELLKFIVIGSLFLGAKLPWGFVPVYALADLIIQLSNLLFYAVLIRVVMSFINPGWHHPAADLLYIVTEPLLRLGRRIVPDISGFDFSPYLIMVSLKIITLFISASLPLHII